MASLEKYWYAVGFWHAKCNHYTPPSAEEIEYIESITSKKVDIGKEYDKGHKQGSR